MDAIRARRPPPRTPVPTRREWRRSPFERAPIAVAAVRRPTRRPRRAKSFRYTVDASVFVNAFNPHEAGHAQSLQILATIQERGDLVMVPTLLVPEIASAVARASGDSTGAVQYANASAAL